MDLGTSHYAGKIVPFGKKNYQETLLELGSMAHLGQNFMLIKLLFNYSCKTCGIT